MIKQMLMIFLTVCILVTPISGAKYGTIEFREGSGLLMKSGILHTDIPPGGYTTIIYKSGSDYVSVDRTGAKQLTGSGAAVLQDAISRGGSIKLLSEVVVDTTVILNNTIDIEGIGWSSGITGAANPIFETDLDVYHYTSLRNLRLAGTNASGNTVLKLYKTWASATPPSFSADHVQFTSLHGDIVEIYGAVYPKFVNCWFNSSIAVGSRDSGNATGVYAWANASGGAMSVTFDTCTFSWLRYGFRTDSTVAVYNCGHQLVNCDMVHVGHGVDMRTGEVIILSGCEFDFNNYPVRLENFTYATITGGWYSARAANATAIDIVNSWFARVQGAHIRSSASAGSKGAAVRIQGSTGSTTGAQMNNIAGNSIWAADPGIWINHDGADTSDNRISGNMIRDADYMHGILLSATTTGNVVEGNMFTSCGAGNIQDSGTNNYVRSGASWSNSYGGN